VLGLVNTPAIPAGGTATVSFTWLPHSGRHTVVVTADKLNQVEESNETNNSRTAVFVVE